MLVSIENLSTFLKNSSRGNRIEKIVVKGTFILIHVKNCLSVWKKENEGNIHEANFWYPIFKTMINPKHLSMYSHILIAKHDLKILIIERNGII